MTLLSEHHIKVEPSAYPFKSDRAYWCLSYSLGYFGTPKRSLRLPNKSTPLAYLF
jgi:hypothetical protein